MPEQKSSVLLTQDENDTVFGLLGYKCQTMATTVVELYTTGGPSSGEWQHKDTGVLCFVKDSAKRSYFFRLYCPIKKKLLWEHEIYNNIDYLAPTPFLHTFEAENCIAGFNFASEEEGKKVRDVLLETIESKKQRRVERRNRYYNNSLAKNVPEMNGMNISVNVNPIIPLVKHQSKKDGKKKYTKADIGQPQDFRHVSHVGWDPNKGFDLEKAVDPQLKEFFTQAGVSETHLRDKETREFIYDFIIRNGGIEKVKEEMEPPPIPTRARAPPRPPVRLGPPPPPPPPLRLQPPRNLPSTPKQEVNNSEVAYPPPPPPPPPPPGPPPPPMTNIQMVSLPDNPRAALMEELTKNKTQLKPLNLDVDVEERKPPSIASDSRGQLMDQIKEGVKLKPVTAAQTNNQTVQHSSGLASALAKALAERNKVIHSDSSSTSESDEADDEWDE